MSGSFPFGFLMLFLSAAITVTVSAHFRKMLWSRAWEWLDVVRIVAFASAALFVAWASTTLVAYLIAEAGWQLGAAVSAVTAGLSLLGLSCASLLPSRKAEMRDAYPTPAPDEIEQRTHHLLEQFPHAAFSVDHAGRFVSVNAVGLELVGMPLTDVKGRSCAEFISSEERPKAATIWKGFKSGEVERADGETVIIARSGERICVRFLLAAQTDAGGQFAGVCGFIEEARRQEEHDETPPNQSARMESLFNLALAVGSSLDLDELLQRLLEIVERAVGFDSANIFIKDGDRYRALAARGYPDPAFLFSLPFEEIAGPTLSTLQARGEPLIISDTAQNPVWRVTESTRLVRCWMGAPLIVRDEMIGVINLNSRHVRRYTVADAQMIAAIASQAAAAIYNARLFAQVQNQASRLSYLTQRLLALQEVSLSLTQASTIPEALDIVRRMASDLIGDSLPVLFALVTSDGKALEFTAVGHKDARHADLLRALGVGPRGGRLCAQEITVQDLAELRDRDPVVARGLEGFRGTVLPRSLLEVLQRVSDAMAIADFPLWSRDRLIGFMTIAMGDEVPTEENLDLLRALSGMAAVAIDSIRLVEDLRQTTSALNSTIASSTDAIVTTNAEQVITTWNPAAERFFAVPSFLALGKKLSDVVPHNHQATMLDAWNGVISGQRVEIPEYEFHLQNGDGFWFHIRGTPLLDTDSSTEGAMFSVRDITRERAVKRQMEQTERLSALGQIVAGVAHELNNPLTSVIGFAQLLRDHPLGPAAMRDVERVITQAKRAARVVQNLLIFARDKEPERVPTDMNRVLLNVIEMRAYELRVGNVQVETDLSPNLPMTLADAHQLQQVFFNLIVNAEQAMLDAHGHGSLRVRTRVSEGINIRVEIEDDGPGIPMENLKRVFDPFFTTKEVGKGTGLGLSICYGIIQEHQGQIWAENRQGGGTLFLIELPVTGTSASPVNDQVQDGSTVELPLAESPLDSVAAAGQRVLIVDDEESITGLLQRVLGHWGYSVHVRDSGEAAWEALQREPFDLIISDVRMPGMGGEELLSRLAEHRPQLVERVIFMTGEIFAPDSEGQMTRFGRPTLQKPFDLNLLESFLRGILTS